MGVLRGKKEAIEPKTGNQGELQTSKIVTLNPDGSLYLYPLLKVGCSTQIYARRPSYYIVVTVQAVAVTNGICQVSAETGGKSEMGRKRRLL